MTVLLGALGAIALLGALAMVPLVLRDGYGPVRTVQHHDTRRPHLGD